MLIYSKITSFILWSNKLHPAAYLMNFISVISLINVKTCLPMHEACSHNLHDVVVYCMAHILGSVRWRTLCH